METTMKFLIDLQDCDKRIKDIQRKKAEAPIRIKMLREELDVIEKQLEDASSKLEACKRERRATEQDIEQLENRMEKSNIKLSNIKSNKEYQAALKEVDDLKQEKSSSEDRALDLMEEIEALEASCAARKEEKEASKEKFDMDREVILAELKSLDAEITDLEKKRALLCQSMDQDMLRQYDFIMGHKGDLAVSPVVKGVCQTCHMGIPPQKFNELIRGEGIMTCPNCSRIIYWAEDECFEDAVGRV